jgi:hypothetical protein
MKTALKLEEAAMFILSIFFFNQLHFSWWWYPVLLLTPDLSMLGYLINTKVGAVAYNAAHHKAVAIGFWLVGFKLANEPLMFAGILLFGHSSFDRLFGYGLKYEDDFKHTHLGWLPGGKNKH